MKIPVFSADSTDPDQTAASDQGLHCLPMSLLRDTRHKWVKVFFPWCVKSVPIKCFHGDSRVYSHNTIVSPYLEVQGTPWNPEILQDICTSTYQDLQNWVKKKNRTITFNKWMSNLTPEVRYIENITKTRRNCSLGEISPPFHNILLPSGI